MFFKCRSGFASRLAYAAIFGLLVSGAASLTPVSRADAQDVKVSTAEFRPALARHGRWERHPRWGEVWVPAGRAVAWRPYQAGHWVYTDQWGWYWVTDDEEAEWGWITYHYGRWVLERPHGWVWIPGNEWGPAWVDWRRGNDQVGWAPLPPDEVAVTVRDNPDYWVFVRPRDLIAPRLSVVFLPFAQRAVYLRQTVVVNRTVIIRDRGPVVVVNPGIPPAYIAVAVGRPIHAYEVRPRVVFGTSGVHGAVVIRLGDNRPVPQIRESVVVRQTTIIQPAKQVPPPQALGRDERGRLGDDPPRAAQRPGTGDEQRQPPARGAQPPVTNELPRQPGAPRGAQPPATSEPPRQAEPPRRAQPPVTNELPRQPGPPRGAQPPAAEPRRPPPRPPVTNELPRQPGPPLGAQPRTAPRPAPAEGRRERPQGRQDERRRP
jgi:Family of unknown function (DUF6600)